MNEVCSVVVSAVAAVLAGPFLAAVTLHVPARRQLRGVRAWCGGEAGLARVVLVSLAAVVVSAAVGWRFAGSLVLLAFLWMGWTGVVLAFIDLDCRRLPDRLVAVMFGGGLVFLGLAAVVGAGTVGQFGRAVFCAVVVLVASLLLALAAPGAVGRGDATLAAALALYLGWLGWRVLALGLIFAVLAAGCIGVTLLIGGRAALRDRFPFGPVLIVAALVTAVTL